MALEPVGAEDSMAKRITAIVVLLALAGCSTTPSGGYQQPTGMLLGAAGGAIAGSQFGSGSGRLAATALGTLIGAGIGSNIGASLDRADAAYARAYSPRYYVPQPPRYYAAAPLPAYYGGPAYAMPGQMIRVTPPVRIAPGCQRVGNGIWCEQSNGTFRAR